MNIRRMVSAGAHVTYTPRKSPITKASYFDKVDLTSAHERVFYVYSLGCYRNTPIYVYGESHDLMSTEFELRSTVPWYKKVGFIPLEHFKGVDRFEEMIQKVPEEHYSVLRLFTPNQAICTAESQAQIVEWMSVASHRASVRT